MLTWQSLLLHFQTKTYDQYILTALQIHILKVQQQDMSQKLTLSQTALLQNAKYRRLKWPRILEESLCKICHKYI